MKRLRLAGRLALALLRELADEGAYLRCLKRRGMKASPEEWRRFTEERYRAQSVRPKCC
jgi:hypothetical protein